MFVILIVRSNLTCFLIFAVKGGKEIGAGIPKEGPVVDFNGIRCILLQRVLPLSIFVV